MHTRRSSKKNTRFPFENQLYVKGDYVNIYAVRKSIQKHIIECNPHCSFDFFIHCCSVDIEDKIVSLYNPKQWKFEDNRVYADDIKNRISDPSQYGQLSSVLSMKKVIDMVDESYDRVILIRPDVLIWKDMLLNDYNKESIYVNKWISEMGDFHFVMSQEHVYIFKNMFESAVGNNLCFGEGWIRKCILDQNNVQLKSDDIEAGKHQEVIRKIKLTSVDRHGIPPSFFMKYGMTNSEINESVVNNY